MRFVIEQDGWKVGLSSCVDCMTNGQPYVSAAKDVKEVLAILARPDIKDGHGKPPEVYACPTCIGSES